MQYAWVNWSNHVQKLRNWCAHSSKTLLTKPRMSAIEVRYNCFQIISLKGTRSQSRVLFSFTSTYHTPSLPPFMASFLKAKRSYLNQTYNVISRVLTHKYFAEYNAVGLLPGNSTMVWNRQGQRQYLKKSRLTYIYPTALTSYSRRVHFNNDQLSLKIQPLNKYQCKVGTAEVL